VLCTVSRRNVKDIIMDYCQGSFKMAYYGIELDNEQKRRYFIKSILQIEGLNLEAYRCHFGTYVLAERLGLCECHSLPIGQATDGILSFRR
jgi:hypothetical protein